MVNRKNLKTGGQADGRTDRQTTDDRRSEKLTIAFSSSELKNITFIYPNFLYGLTIGVLGMPKVS